MREFLTSKVTEFIHSAIFFFLFSFLWSWGDQFPPRFCRFLWWSSSQVSSEKLLSPRFSLLHLGFSLPHITWKNLGHHWRWRKVAILPTHSLLLLRWEKSTSWSRPNEPNEMKKRPKPRENRPFVFQTCLRQHNLAKGRFLNIFPMRSSNGSSGGEERQPSKLHHQLDFL